MFVEWVRENMKKAVLILIIIVSIVSGCNKEEKKKTDAIIFKEEYETLNGKTIENNTYQKVSIPEDNAIQYSNIEEVLHLLKEGTAIIYFGAPDDFLSRSIIETLLNTANMVGIETIYYLNATEIRDTKHLDINGEIVTEKEGTKEYYQLLDVLEPHLPIYEGLKNETIKRLYFPTIVFVKDGEIIGCHTRKANPNTDLTKEEEKELALIYSEYMHTILGDVCNKEC